MLKDTAHLLIVDDERNVRRVLATLLEQAGYSTTPAASGEQALDLVRAQDPDLVLTDLAMGEMDGMQLLGRLSAEFPEIPVVMLTAHGTVENAVEAMRRGAHDFLTKPFDREQVLAVISRALGQAERRRLEYQGPRDKDRRCGLVGRSAAHARLCDDIEKIAPSPTTVLIRGETGTGKELIADALHALSPRAERPLIKINCGALPEQLVESELFGHERGAFTGADRAKPGRFELADGGTLFLDEIGELQPSIQVKLLRVLQERSVDRVGGATPRPIDVRLVAATHRDLAAEVEAGRFREDLYYRLKVIELVVPPLRERSEDVAPLVEFFVTKHAARLDRKRPVVSAQTVTLLESRPWPGNVRELENAIERAVVLGDGDELGPADLGLEPAASAPPTTEGSARSSLKEASRAAAAQTERRMIAAALAETAGNVTRTAERLGLSRRGLQIKMKELGLR